MREEPVPDIILGVQPHEFLPHYVTINELLSRMDTAELECLRKRMICALLRKRKFEGVGSLGNTGWSSSMPQGCSIFRKGTAPIA